MTAVKVMAHCRGLPVSPQVDVHMLADGESINAKWKERELEISRMEQRAALITSMPPAPMSCLSWPRPRRGSLVLVAATTAPPAAPREAGDHLARRRPGKLGRPR